MKCIRNLKEAYEYLKSNKKAYVVNIYRRVKQNGIYDRVLEYEEINYIVNDGKKVARLYIIARNQLSPYLKTVKVISDSKIILKFKDRKVKRKRLRLIYRGYA
jgi:hypothetical protein